MDVFSKEKRSEVMSRIRGKWTGQEVTLHNFLKGNKVRHVCHPKMYGSPDFYIPGMNAVVFLDRCFWHGCRKHFRMPKSNVAFWKRKIFGNVFRDKRNREILAMEGYRVFSFFECEMKSDLENIIRRLSNAG